MKIILNLFYVKVNIEKLYKLFDYTREFCLLELLSDNKLKQFIIDFPEYYSSYDDCVEDYKIYLFHFIEYHRTQLDKSKKYNDTFEKDPFMLKEMPVIYFNASDSDEEIEFKINHALSLDCVILRGLLSTLDMSEAILSIRNILDEQNNDKVYGWEMPNDIFPDSTIANKLLKNFDQEYFVEKKFSQPFDFLAGKNTNDNKSINVYSKKSKETLPPQVFNPYDNFKIKRNNNQPLKEVENRLLKLSNCSIYDPKIVQFEISRLLSQLTQKIKRKRLHFGKTYYKHHSQTIEIDKAYYFEKQEETLVDLEFNKKLPLKLRYFSPFNLLTYLKDDKVPLDNLLQFYSFGTFKSFGDDYTNMINVDINLGINELYDYLIEETMLNFTIPSIYVNDAVKTILDLEGIDVFGNSIGIDTSLFPNYNIFLKNGIPLYFGSQKAGDIIIKGSGTLNFQYSQGCAVHYNYHLVPKSYIQLKNLIQAEKILYWNMSKKHKYRVNYSIFLLMCDYVNIEHVNFQFNENIRDIVKEYLFPLLIKSINEFNILNTQSSVLPICVRDIYNDHLLCCDECYSDIVNCYIYCNDCEFHSKIKKNLCFSCFRSHKVKCNSKSSPTINYRYNIWELETLVKQLNYRSCNYDNKFELVIPYDSHRNEYNLIDARKNAFILKEFINKIKEGFDKNTNMPSSMSILNLNPEINLIVNLTALQNLKDAYIVYSEHSFLKLREIQSTKNNPFVSISEIENKLSKSFKEAKDEVNSINEIQINKDLDSKAKYSENVDKVINQDKVPKFNFMDPSKKKQDEVNKNKKKAKINKEEAVSEIIENSSNSINFVSIKKEKEDKKKKSKSIEKVLEEIEENNEDYVDLRMQKLLNQIEDLSEDKNSEQEQKKKEINVRLNTKEIHKETLLKPVIQTTKDFNCDDNIDIITNIKEEEGFHINRKKKNTKNSSNSDKEDHVGVDKSLKESSTMENNFVIYFNTSNRKDDKKSKSNKKKENNLPNAVNYSYSNVKDENASKKYSIEESLISRISAVSDSFDKNINESKAKISGEIKKAKQEESRLIRNNEINRIEISKSDLSFDICLENKEVSKKNEKILKNKKFNGEDSDSNKSLDHPKSKKNSKTFVINKGNKKGKSDQTRKNSMKTVSTNNNNNINAINTYPSKNKEKKTYSNKNNIHTGLSNNSSKATSKNKSTNSSNIKDLIDLNREVDGFSDKFANDADELREFYRNKFLGNSGRYMTINVWTIKNLPKDLYHIKNCFNKYFCQFLKEPPNNNDPFFLQSVQELIEYIRTKIVDSKGIFPVESMIRDLKGCRNLNDCHKGLVENINFYLNEKKREIKEKEKRERKK